MVSDLWAGHRSILLLRVALLCFFCMAVIVEDFEYIGGLKGTISRKRTGIGMGKRTVEEAGIPVRISTSTNMTKTYSAYRPKKEAMDNFTYMVHEYISPTYVPYQTIVDYPLASPYETRWSDVRRPKWATKVGQGQGDYWNKEVPRGKHICYCSVGKAAGSSVSSLLGFQLHGPEVYFIPSGLLAHYTTHMFHYDVNDCADDMPYYLFTMRHPLARLQSAFRYDRDKHRDRKNSIIYDKCKFTDLNTLAIHGLSAHSSANSSVTEKCQQLAYDLVSGSGYEYSRHMFANYHYYLNVSFARAQHPETSKILVIRTEHMEDDWNAAERAVRNDDDAFPPTFRIELNVPHLNVNKQDTSSHNQDAFLSTEAQVLLCDALCQEIQTYKRILEEAVNLSLEDFDQSMAELAKSCPLQALSDKNCEE